jgi:signal transduction histidine kinase
VLLRTADEALQGMVRLIHDHQQLTRGMERAPGPVDLAAVAETCAKQSQGAAAGIAKVTVEARLSPPVLASRERLEQVALNLVLNALKALEEAGRSDGKIVLRVDPTTAGAALVVQDDGPGIPASVQSKLFQPFVSSGTGRAGLGLFLSRRLIEAMGGSLTWRPAHPRGAAFRIHLPVAIDRATRP